MTGNNPSATVRLFHEVLVPVPGSGARPPGWLRRPAPPAQLRDAPCRKRPDLFGPIPETGRIKRPPAEREEITYQITRARRLCNGVPGYDTPCPFQMQCLSWALQAKERVVAGGVVVTRTMIHGFEKSTQEEIDADQARTPEDWAGELAARSRSRARKRQPNQGPRGQSERESA